MVGYYCIVLWSCRVVKRNGMTQWSANLFYWRSSAVGAHGLNEMVLPNGRLLWSTNLFVGVVQPSEPAG